MHVVFVPVDFGLSSSRPSTEKVASEDSSATHEQQTHGTVAGDRFLSQQIRKANLAAHPKAPCELNPKPKHNKPKTLTRRNTAPHAQNTLILGLGHHSFLLGGLPCFKKHVQYHNQELQLRVQVVFTHDVGITH